MQRKSGAGGGVRWVCFQSAGGQSICERRIEGIMKMQKKKSRWGSGRGGGGSQGGCVRRIEVVKMPKKSGSGRGVRSEVRVDVYVELKLFGGGRRVGDWLVARLGVVGDVGYGGCQLRIEGIVKYT